MMRSRVSKLVYIALFSTTVLIVFLLVKTPSSLLQKFSFSDGKNGAGLSIKGDAEEDAEEDTDLGVDAGFLNHDNRVQENVTLLGTSQAGVDQAFYKIRFPTQSMDIGIRGQWQSDQVKRFCSKYNISQVINMPRPKTLTRSNLFRHLLYNDDKKLLLCYLPKVGCTNTRRLMFILSGALSMETITWEDVSEDILRPVLLKSSLEDPRLSDEERMKKLSSYWKFTILRNPLERLVSAFRDKLEAPFNFSSMNRYTQFFEKMKQQIVKKYQESKFDQWIASNGSSELKLHFQTYIQWIIDTPNENLNEHFCPMVYLSQPCRMHYDFYGNFKTLSADMNLVLKKHKIPSEYFYDQSRYVQGNGTTALLQKYYSTVSAEVKQALFKDFFMELDYYYHLFPGDRESHISLLGVKEFI